MLMPSAVLKESDIDMAAGGGEGTNAGRPVDSVRNSSGLERRSSHLLPSHVVERCQPRGETHKGDQAG